MPALKDLSEDKNWRIKLSVVEQYPALAKQLGENFFTEKLVPICIKWLSDSIFSIRIAAIKNLKELTSLLGSNWAEKNVLKDLTELAQSTNYLHRMTPIVGIGELSQVVSMEVVKKWFCPLLFQLSKDPIPNIRLNVGKSIL